MRLRRLDLTRYGRFTDHSLDFGERAEGTPDLHVVYGPNEAGKSTLFSAILDLLFGMPMQSRYGFIHPYPTMRVGAAVDLNAGKAEFVRLKKPQNSLFDQNSQPVPEAAIRADLGGIDRDSYRTMFSLDDETLEAGGKSILASKGDLGQLLFSASAGLADLSRQLADISAEADRFHKLHARDSELSRLKERLDELKTERERLDMLAPEHKGLVAERDRLRTSFREAETERGASQRRIAEIERLLDGLGKRGKLNRLREDLAGIGELPDPPAGWSTDLPALRDEGIKLGARRDSLARAVDDLGTLVASITVDEVALGMAARHEALKSERARDLTAEKDLPERRLQLQQIDSEIGGILHSLGRPSEPDPRRLVLPAPTAGRLRGLIESRSGIAAAVAAAAAEEDAASKRLDSAERALGASGGGAVPDEAALALLSERLATARAGNFEAMLRGAGRARSAARQALDDRLAALAPWRGEADALPAMPVPAVADLTRSQAELAGIDKRLEKASDEARTLAAEIARLEAERSSLRDGKGFVGDDEAATSRAERDEAWALHRGRLDAETADAFAEALRRDDQVTAARFGQISDSARYNQLGAGLALARAAHGQAAVRAEAASAERASLLERVATVARAMSPGLEDFSPAALTNWLAARAEALTARSVLRERTDETDNAADDLARAERGLTEALGAAGSPVAPDAAFGDLLLSAQQVLDRRGLATAAAEARRALGLRQAETDAANSADAAWKADWQAACAACWLGEDGAAPQLTAVRSILEISARLGAVLDRRNELSHRIIAMTEDQAAFARDIQALAAALELETAGKSSAALDREIAGLIASATKNAERKRTETERLAGLRQEQGDLAGAMARHAERTAGMTAHFAVATLGEVEEKLRLIARRDELRQRAGEAESEIADGLGCDTVEEAEARLAEAGRDALEGELADLVAGLPALETRARELFAQSRAAADRLDAIGSDAGVAGIEERRRTVLLEIEEGAVAWLRLKAGTIAAEQALRAYRDQHRSSMMKSASDAFRTISRGAYTGLATQPEKEAETLIALSAEGGSKSAADLSKGTQFQLYLALRVAGYHEFVRSNATLPFIADDIMETFDDFRAEEAFRLFAGMAGVGQVIYLTHHRHLCEIAKAVCPSVTIHVL